MDWKTEAVEKLKLFEVRRQALQNIPLEIAQIESALTGIRSARTDRIPSGNRGSNTREDVVLNYIVRKSELQRNLEQAGMWVEAVSAALDALSTDERRILDKLYISREKRAAGALAAEMCVDLNTVYRKKDQALRKFTIALYGYTET